MLSQTTIQEHIERKLKGNESTSLTKSECDYLIEVLQKADKFDKAKEILSKYRNTLELYYDGKPRDLLEADVLKDLEKVIND